MPTTAQTFVALAALNPDNTYLVSDGASITRLQNILGPDAQYLLVGTRPVQTQEQLGSPLVEKPVVESLHIDDTAPADARNRINGILADLKKTAIHGEGAAPLGTFVANLSKEKRAAGSARTPC